MIAAFILLLLTCTFLIVAAIIAYDQIVVAKVPFIRLSRATVKEIFTHLKLKPGSVVYDLGCGDARVLIEAAKVQPNATYIGIEKALMPYIMAKYNARNHSQITIRRADVLKTNFERANLVFMYLMPELIDELRLGLEKIIISKQHIVAVEFAPKFMKPKNKYMLKHPSELAKNWYYY